MILPFLLATPWLGILLFLALRVRLPRDLPERRPSRFPRVSVIVPARNEAANIGACVGSLLEQEYPDFEVIVLDDRSDDGTGDLVRAMGPGGARSLRVLDGEELPAGWTGKPWACWQGARAATGDLILFTDADTVHAPDLLPRAVAAMEKDDADLLTVSGRQLMGSFWERLVQPQVFFAMLLRYFDVDKAVSRGRWRGAIANGQYLLFRREAYEALGGHEAVSGDVVEDLALAQLVVRRSRRLSIRLAESALATRMYRSLRELVDGWSKNIMLGGLRTMPPWARPFVAPTFALSGVVLWMAPPAVLVACVAPGFGGAGLIAWSATAVALSLVLWTGFTRRMGAPARYGLLYPLGAAVAVYIVLRAWRRGRNVEWKGRTYVLEHASEAP